ncbi:S-adenosyl-L-methionine-dependent methyltransferase [Choiromyces venosus 120613-1]|uniref:S-adenosyl-L-methionine-dependent methyltransferase n=1 Tax=Choiromyces venosus 120613-1 TaxID=1336337 RepID=A0A3N4JVG6_9PEZI|nr:S-adenosyl-L-methionine-dependent methyltransferase [Choiromyces venosus 120613-1]
MSTKLVSPSPYMVTAVSLLELAEQVSTAAASISQHLRSKSLNEPNFSPTSQGLPKDPEIENAKKSLLVASKALTVLATDPLTHLREVFFGLNESSALKVAVEWKVAHILSTAGTPMHISELAKKAGADEYRLLTAMRLLANSYVFAEVRPGVFAHNFSSIHLTDRSTECFISYCMEVVYFASEGYSESMRKHGSSTKPNEAAFNVGLNTDKPFWEWIHGNPDLCERFNECMKPMGASSYARLRTVFPWRSLGDALLIDIGGGNGHITFRIAQEAPDLKVMIQDKEQPIAEAKQLCPDSLKPRFSYRVHDFFETQPVVADVYFMRMVLHFLTDENCVKLLKSIIPAMKPGARILVAESVFPTPGLLPNPQHKYVISQNWNMVTLLNAKERTFDEFAEIFYAADKRFKLRQWGESGGAPSSEILEATLPDTSFVESKL